MAGGVRSCVNPAQRIDLLDLTNGVLAELGQTPLPAGQYTQVRLVLRPNGCRHAGQRDRADTRARKSRSTRRVRHRAV